MAVCEISLPNQGISTILVTICRALPYHNITEMLKPKARKQTTDIQHFPGLPNPTLATIFARVACEQFLSTLRETRDTFTWTRKNRTIKSILRCYRLLRALISVSFKLLAFICFSSDFILSDNVLLAHASLAFSHVSYNFFHIAFLFSPYQFGHDVESSTVYDVRKFDTNTTCFFLGSFAHDLLVCCLLLFIENQPNSSLEQFTKPCYTVPLLNDTTDFQ